MMHSNTHSCEEADEMNSESMFCPKCGMKGLMSEFRESHYCCQHCGARVKLEARQSKESLDGGPASFSLELVKCRECSRQILEIASTSCVVCRAYPLCQIHRFRGIPVCDKCLDKYERNSRCHYPLITSSVALLLGSLILIGLELVHWLEKLQVLTSSSVSKIPEGYMAGFAGILLIGFLFAVGFLVDVNGGIRKFKSALDRHKETQVPSKGEQLHVPKEGRRKIQHS